MQLYTHRSAKRLSFIKGSATEQVVLKTLFRRSFRSNSPDDITSPHHQYTLTRCHLRLHLGLTGRQSATNHVIGVAKQRLGVRSLWDLNASNASAVDSLAAYLTLALVQTRRVQSMQLCSSQMVIELQHPCLHMDKGLLRVRHGRKVP